MGNTRSGEPAGASAVEDGECQLNDEVRKLIACLLSRLRLVVYNNSIFYIWSNIESSNIESCQELASSKFDSKVGGGTITP